MYYCIILTMYVLFYIWDKFCIWLYSTFELSMHLNITYGTEHYIQKSTVDNLYVIILQ